MERIELSWVRGESHTLVQRQTVEQALRKIRVVDERPTENNRVDFSLYYHLVSVLGGDVSVQQKLRLAIAGTDERSEGFKHVEVCLWECLVCSGRARINMTD